jgi:hypothetical protein
MDHILMESDKYLSVDSSIDDLLTDALSKRRARSIGCVHSRTLSLTLSLSLSLTHTHTYVYICVYMYSGIIGGGLVVGLDDR